MSSREPLWYCYECHAEMRPLMAPDPHCASCNGTFVEKLENPSDDPRDFQEAGIDDEAYGPDEFLCGYEGTWKARELSSLLADGLQNLLAGARPNSPPGPPNGPRSPGGGGFTIHINRTRDNNGLRTVISGGPPRTGTDGTGQIPTFTEYMAQHGRGGGQGPGRGTIEGPLMLQYLLAMLQQPGGRGDQFLEMFGGAHPSGAETGRWGDYVFNQEALDQIITQIMENSQAHPVAATEEIMKKLPRDVLEEGSPLLDKDCAICKDQFTLTTEDPDEQVIVTLPCKHPFHEPCIMPWLKSSGTCPVCR
ncbi:hypothetical protein NM688_g7132 [Phlebia brevispora]|uniref:Uncharacterized protein n=1 Tax=Phlebia brevispora TaxID=194682 RepID=A0ACC1S8Q0_9APHY|nr:hypothetical protein NM688_g7132 [Phlebia brevispora]